MGQDELVGGEQRELGVHLRTLRRHGSSVVQRESADSVARELEVHVLCGAVRARKGEEQVLALTVRGQLSCQHDFDRRGHDEPRLARDGDLEHLDATNPPSCRVERSRRARVRVGAEQELPRPREPVLGDHLMADAVAANVEEVCNVECGAKLARQPMTSGIAE